MSCERRRAFCRPGYAVRTLNSAHPTFTRMVFVHHQINGGRKLIRPIVEEAVNNWSG